MKKAKFFKKVEDEKVKCQLCPHYCLIPEGNSGICQGRINKNGDLYSENYGKISSIGIDPIEKKPLYHFHPAGKILSLGTFGCNFTCSFCQNWRISQERPKLKEYSPEQIIEIALNKDVIGIAYTYSEPLVWLEYILKVSKLASKHNLKNVIVSNGFINEEPLKELIPYLDGANIDVKSFNPGFYSKYTGGRLEPVLNSVETLYKGEVHLELTTLLIEGVNDSETELNKLFSWVQNIDPDIPFHLSRYFPNYEMEKSRTSTEVMKKAYNLAVNYLNFVYLGNIRTQEGQNTNCPQCDNRLITRNTYHSSLNIDKDKCPECGYKLPGRFIHN